MMLVELAEYVGFADIDAWLPRRLSRADEEVDAGPLKLWPQMR
jgi:hypothetical protein